MNMKLMVLLFSLLFAATAAAPVYVEGATAGRLLQQRPDPPTIVNGTIGVIAMVNARLGTTGGINHVDPPGQRRLVATLADYADPTRCHADPLCLRVHAMEPTMPIAPKLADGVVKPKP